MNKIVSEQLKKVQVADISNFDEVNNVIYIPKNINLKLEKNNQYIVELNDSCFDKKHYININYNGGKIPVCKSCMIEVLAIIGKAVKVNAISYDIDNNTDTGLFWSGYLPLNCIKIIRKE